MYNFPNSCHQQSLLYVSCILLLLYSTETVGCDTYEGSQIIVKAFTEKYQWGYSRNRPTLLKAIFEILMYRRICFLIYTKSVPMAIKYEYLHCLNLFRCCHNSIGKLIKCQYFFQKLSFIVT